VTAPALDAITRLDLGVAKPGDVVLSAVYDRKLSEVLYRTERQLQQQPTQPCEVCGEPLAPDEVDECIPCSVEWDVHMNRVLDL